MSLQRLQLETSDFVHELATWSISLLTTNCPPGGRGQGHVTNLYILGADEARHFKFGLLIERKEYWHYTC